MSFDDPEDKIRIWNSIRSISETSFKFINCPVPNDDLMREIVTKIMLHYLPNCGLVAANEPLPAVDTAFRSIVQVIEDFDSEFPSLVDKFEDIEIILMLLEPEAQSETPVEAG
ncbi:uncharacterized protein LOC134831943 [Culicoides brevitarsis]|uniref:uncharacterized protein LOC134831943 n=1 Tax=Culicoides brevitarsis TaxID=469753 RepID=UPI00307C1381